MALDRPGKHWLLLAASNPIVDFTGASINDGFHPVFQIRFTVQNTTRSAIEVHKTGRFMVRRRMERAMALVPDFKILDSVVIPPNESGILTVLFLDECLEQKMFWHDCWGGRFEDAKYGSSGFVLIDQESGLQINIPQPRKAGA
jgi:hypothetical protein